MIGTGYLARYAIPLIVATVYFGDEDILKQISFMEDNSKTTDKILSQARGEGNAPEESFDYIIVGAGSAGAVVANRLTQSGKNRVLLLEAGGDPNPVMDVPWARRLHESGEFMSWGYSTVNKRKLAAGLMG